MIKPSAKLRFREKKTGENNYRQPDNEEHNSTGGQPCRCSTSGIGTRKQREKDASSCCLRVSPEMDPAHDDCNQAKQPPNHIPIFDHPIHPVISLRHVYVGLGIAQYKHMFLNVFICNSLKTPHPHPAPPSPPSTSPAIRHTRIRYPRRNRARRGLCVRRCRPGLHST